MRIFLLVCWIFGLNVSFAQASHATTFICEDAKGAKSFSKQACTEVGLKNSKTDLKIYAGKPIAAIVIMPVEMKTAPVASGKPHTDLIPIYDENGKLIPGAGKIKRAEELPLEKPVLYFLIAAVGASAFILIFFFARYVKIRQEKLVLRDD